MNDWLYALLLSPFAVLLIACCIQIYRMFRYGGMSVAEKDGCKVLHDTALAERELYAEVRSASAASHVRDCVKDLIQIEYR